MAAISSLAQPVLLQRSQPRAAVSDSRGALGSPAPPPQLLRGRWPSNIFLSSNRPYGFSRCHKTRFLVPCAVDLTAGDSNWPGNLDIDGIINSLRKHCDTLPQPVKNFPWNKVLTNFCQLFFELFSAVAKYLFIPLLAVSSLSEMSYCAHEKKMTLIPIPFLAGLAVAGVLKDTAVELSPDIKEGGFPWHLLWIASFFLLLKLPGPYYPYWGRLLIPHFANGGLWRTTWSVIMWYRLSKRIPGMRSGGSLSENPPEEDK